jgi:hypothetical protein
MCFRKYTSAPFDGLRSHEVVRLEVDAAGEIGGQGSFERGDNLGAVLDNEFDAGIVLCELDVIVAYGTTDLQFS